MRISDWSSDVCSSDLHLLGGREVIAGHGQGADGAEREAHHDPVRAAPAHEQDRLARPDAFAQQSAGQPAGAVRQFCEGPALDCAPLHGKQCGMGAEVLDLAERSEEHTSELQSLMRISYAVLCLKKKTTRSSY